MEPEEQKKLLWRALIWVVGLLIVLAISAFVYEVLIPPVTAEAAVNQLKDSNEAYQVLRTTEQLKNHITTIVALVLVVWSIGIWWKPYRQAYKSWKEGMAKGLGL